MKNSQEFLSKQNIVSFLSLARRTVDNKTVGTGPHEVKMIKDAVGKRTNPRTNQPEEGIWFLMEENGQQVKYFVPFFDRDGQPHYLLQRLGTVPEDTIITLEYVKREGSMKGYIDVRTGETKISDDEIPVIEPGEDSDETDPNMALPF